jgi:hypothetical protein
MPPRPVSIHPGQYVGVSLDQIRLVPIAATSPEASGRVLATPIDRVVDEAREQLADSISQMIRSEYIEGAVSVGCSVSGDSMPRAQRQYCYFCGESAAAGRLRQVPVPANARLPQPIINLRGGRTEDGHDYANVCDYCEGNMQVCSHCQTWNTNMHHVRVRTASGPVTNRVREEWWCTECRRNAVVCMECEGILSPDVARRFEDRQHHVGYLCDYCATNGRVRTCHECHIEMPTAWSRQFPNRRYYVCQQCYNERVCSCPGCGGHYERTECQEDPLIQGTFYCRSCFPVQTTIRSYNFIPNYQPFLDAKEENDRKKLLFGIEIEVEDLNGRSRETHAGIAQGVMRKMPFLFCKHDGSIHCGFEMVTQPLSWKFLQNHFSEFQPMFELSKDGFRSFQTETCGMHVHMSKAAFTHIHLYKFLRMFYDFPQFIALISQRHRISKLLRWASLTPGEKLTRKAKTMRQCENKYVAVNLLHPNTVEIRVFRGTINPCSFMKNVEFCKAVYDFTKHASLKELTLENFIAFAKQGKKDFPNLFRFLNDNKFFGGPEMIARFSSHEPLNEHMNLEVLRGSSSPENIAYAVYPITADILPDFDAGFEREVGEGEIQF